MEHDQHDRCSRCGHTWSFHRKREEAECRAMGCKVEPEGHRCPGFVSGPPASP